MIAKAVILSTGDELMTGKVVDSNSTFIADRLLAAGIETAAVLKVGDQPQQLLWALNQAQDLGDIIIGTGGMGPTSDDLSSEIVAEFLGCQLKQDDQIAAALKQRFEARGLAWTANNLKQAVFPEGAEIIPNPIGTAPGFRTTLQAGKILIWLSGVPQEMALMLDQSVMPWIARQNGPLEPIMAATFKIYGVTESKLDDMMGSIELGSQAKVSFRAHYPDLTLRLTVRGDGERTAIFTRLRKNIRETLGSFIYAEGDATLEEVVGRLLLQKRLLLALAESCTGGYISHRITRTAGSSAYYYGGVVTYSNEAKTRFLGVRSTTLEKYGAVSQETALEMSRGICECTGAHIGLSVTGIAGPSGGNTEKPVGTVWVSILQNRYHEAKLFHFHGDRERIILGTSQAALAWLRTVILTSPE